MPKCNICGRKYDTLTALREHHRAVHRKEKFIAPKVSASRNLLLGSIIAVIVIGAVVGYLIYEQQITGSAPASPLLRTPISSSLFQNLANVSFSTLNAIGNGAANTPTFQSSGTPIYSGGKPEVLYIGAEFCPYCAAERWSMIVALAKFGTFSNLEYMQSAPNDGNIATLTFVSASYNSSYITFVHVENEDRNHAPLQTPAAGDQILWNQYNANSYPFVDIGGNYTLNTSQFSYAVLSGLNWTQIGSQLDNPGSNVAKAIDGGANSFISAICKIDGGNPVSVCGQRFAKLLSYIPESGGGLFSFLLNGADAFRVDTFAKSFI